MRVAEHAPGDREDARGTHESRVEHDAEGARDVPPSAAIEVCPGDEPEGGRAAVDGEVEELLLIGGGVRERAIG